MIDDRPTTLSEAIDRIEELKEERDRARKKLRTWRKTVPLMVQIGYETPNGELAVEQERRHDFGANSTIRFQLRTPAPSVAVMVSAHETRWEPWPGENGEKDGDGDGLLLD